VVEHTLNIQKALSFILSNNKKKVKLINFMLCIFYNIYYNKKEETDKIAHKETPDAIHL
jgi:hypothetical protein